MQPLDLNVTVSATDPAQVRCFCSCKLGSPAGVNMYKCLKQQMVCIPRDPTHLKKAKAQNPAACKVTGNLAAAACTVNTAACISLLLQSTSAYMVIAYRTRLRLM